MPRAKPTVVQENRMTLGTFERQWLVEQEDWVKSRLNIASAGVVLVPVAAVAGLGLLGYGAYTGMCALAGAIPVNPLENPLKWIAPTLYDDDSPDNIRKDDGSFLGFILNGFKTNSQKEREQAADDAVNQGGGGGDF